MSERVYKQIKRVALISTGTTPPTNIDDYYTSEDVDWYTPSDFSYETISTMPAEKKISNRFFSESAHNLYNSDSVAIVGIGATVGKVGFINHAFYANQQINILSFNREVLPKYAAYYLFTERDRITSTTPSVTLPILNQTRLGNLWINYPSLDVQQRIVSYLDAETAKIDHAIELLKKKRGAYTRLKASVINRVVTRGLNPNVKLKDSGVEWIGRIPEGWKLIPLKGNISIQKGKTPTELDFEGSGFPYLTMDYLRNRTDRNVMYPVNSEGLISIDANELLVLWDGANAGEFILSKQGYLGSTMAVINVNSRIYYKGFFYYLLKSIEPTSKYFSNGTTIPHFDSGFFYGRFYPAPSIKEQHAIASYLDTRCARIDKAAAIVDKQIDAYTRLKKSLINEVVTGKRRV